MRENPVGMFVGLKHQFMVSYNANAKQGYYTHSLYSLIQVNAIKYF